jgi:hypothetical protein
MISAIMKPYSKGRVAKPHGNQSIKNPFIDEHNSDVATN